MLIEQAKQSGKPQEIAEKMVEGRIPKILPRSCTIGANFVIDGESKVADVLKKTAHDAGGDC